MRTGELAAEAGVDVQTLRYCERRGLLPERAERERFLGAPAVRVDGSDVDPRPRERTDCGLECRIHRSEEGRSRLPPAEWIRAALGRTHG